MARHTRTTPTLRAVDYGAVLFCLLAGEDVEAVDVAEALKAAGKSLADLDRDLARARRAAMVAAQDIATGSNARLKAKR